MSKILLLLSLTFSLTIATIPNSCGYCPKGTSYRIIWVTALPHDCALIINEINGNTVNGLVSYTSICGDPGFRSQSVCVVTPSEKETPK